MVLSRPLCCALLCWPASFRWTSTDVSNLMMWTSIVKQMRPVAHMGLTCGTTFTQALAKMVKRKQAFALFSMRCFAAMQPENVWRVHNYMASPKSMVRGFQKLANELRVGELWWYHFGHPDMPIERIHPSRRMCYRWCEKWRVL